MLLGLVLVQWSEGGSLTEELDFLFYFTAHFATTKLAGWHQNYIAYPDLVLSKSNLI